jgi:hypothetical protein
MSEDIIVEINGCKLFIDDDHCDTRRNIICYSDALHKHIIENKLEPTSIYHVYLVSRLVQNNTPTDIQIIDVKGFY